MAALRCLRRNSNSASACVSARSNMSRKLPARPLADPLSGARRCFDHGALRPASLLSTLLRLIAL
eukprot:1195457-Prorocentrum_minimum.AAC.1